MTAKMVPIMPPTIAATNALPYAKAFPSPITTIENPIVDPTKRPRSTTPKMLVWSSFESGMAQICCTLEVRFILCEVTCCCHPMIEVWTSKTLKFWRCIRIEKT